MTTQPGCVLCEGPGGRLVFEGAKLRVIHAQEAGFPAFYRVVWRDHAPEFSDLDAAERALCMEAVAVVEQMPARASASRPRSILPRSATWWRTCIGT
jgi:diadenosine tetraphosphate (Ap4A) HIT family hydrolase